jgi:hypothetical protein
MASVTTQRIVPGAPPPAAAPMSKLAKKKHKSASKLHSSSDSLSTITSSPSAQSHTELAPNGVSGHGTPTSSTPQLDSVALNHTQKTSPFIDVVSKRLKATQKKIVKSLVYSLFRLPSSYCSRSQSRIKSYASNENLNEDQKRTAQTLSSLEFLVRELEELKKAVEVTRSLFSPPSACHLMPSPFFLFFLLSKVIDSDVALEDRIRREAAEEAEKFRILQVVSDTKVYFFSFSSDLLILKYPRLSFRLKHLILSLFYSLSCVYTLLPLLHTPFCNF